MIKKGDVLGMAIYIFAVLMMLLLTWGVGKLVSDSLSDYKVISPEEGVNCVVVSRMFNTSVDCWGVK